MKIHFGIINFNTIYLNVIYINYIYTYCELLKILIYINRDKINANIIRKSSNI